MSLDGFIEDAGGGFAWAMPSEEVHRFANELDRTVGTHLYGRRMYDTLKVWQEMDVSAMPDCIADYQQIWRAAEKIVYSKTLDSAPTDNTRIEREFDTEAVRELKAATQRDIAIGGPALAAEAFRAGLIDEVNLVVSPVTVGGGKPALPADQLLNLELLATRQFENGAVHLRYAVRR